MDSWIHDGCWDSRWILAFAMDSGIHDGFQGHDGFLDSRWILGFTMDPWIHDELLDSRGMLGFTMGFEKYQKALWRHAHFFIKVATTRHGHADTQDSDTT